MNYISYSGMVNVSPILSKPGITSPNHHSSSLLSSLNRRDRKRSAINVPFQVNIRQIEWNDRRYLTRRKNNIFVLMAQLIWELLQGADSSSNTSSCNSSTPSSPALLPGSQSQTHQAPVKQQFDFPGNFFSSTIINYNSG